MNATGKRANTMINLLQNFFETGMTCTAATILVVKIFFFVYLTSREVKINVSDMVFHCKMTKALEIFHMRCTKSRVRGSTGLNTYCSST